MGKRLGGFLSQPGLILGVDSNCSGGREKRLSCVKKLRNRIKPKFSRGYVSKVRRLLNPGEIVVPTFQTSGLAGLQGNRNSRLLGATGRRGQPISTVNSLKTARNQVGLLEEGRVSLTNEFLFLDQSPTLPTAGSYFAIMACLWRPPIHRFR